MKILFLVIFLVSCGVDDIVEVNNTTTVEKLDLGDFRPYVQMFMLEAKAQGKIVKDRGLTITFAELDFPVVGVCYTYINSPPKIKVDPSWKTMNIMKRMTLMYHELGHCLLGRGHTNSFSIMQSQILSSYTMLTNEDELFKELFMVSAGLTGSDGPSGSCGGIQSELINNDAVDN